MMVVAASSSSRAAQRTRLSAMQLVYGPAPGDLRVGARVCSWRPVACEVVSHVSGVVRIWQQFF